MPLLDDIKKELELKRQELQERKDELDKIIDFINDLNYRLSDIEKEIIASSTDSATRNRNLEQKKSLEQERADKIQERDEIREKIQALQDSIELLEKQTG